MNWARDNAYIGHTGPDTRGIFRYDTRVSIAVKIAQSNQYRAQIWPLYTSEQWNDWLEEHCEDSDRGLVLILARRAGESLLKDVLDGPLAVSDWIAHLEAGLPPKSFLRRSDTFAALNEKTIVEHRPTDSPKPSGSVRDLPFSRSTFENICAKFQIHDSIVRAVSRADVPLISCEQVKMSQQAFIYNCRTPNSWASDLALSATHFSESGMSYAVMYGCTVATEKLVLRKLQLVNKEAAHPLLMPGVLAELELSRHTRLVESNVTDVETKIFELNLQSEVMATLRQADIDQRNEAKRTAWLDLTYLRNSLITWNAQLDKLMKHTKRLEHVYLSERHSIAMVPPPLRDAEERIAWYPGRGSWVSRVSSPEFDSNTKASTVSIEKSGGATCLSEIDQRNVSTETPLQMGDRSGAYTPFNVRHSSYNQEDDQSYIEHMLEVNRKTEVRLAAIMDEYEEKIRDCTMRIDGMAMATQWSHSETAVEIALATRRDSRVMRSIALVTMVFLPGTFFATVFSMTFFDWSDSNGGAQVSSYLWIYILVTVVFTAITIGLWYYCVIHHRRTKRVKESDDCLI